jgi:hypothetical protein
MSRKPVAERFEMVLSLTATTDSVNLSIREGRIGLCNRRNQAHLRRVLREYVDYYNRARPHRGLNQQAPIIAQ